MSTAQLLLPPKLVPVFTGDAMYRGAHGGRGSAKTRSFATMTAVRGYQCAAAGQDGVIVCAREHLNSLADSSFSEVKGAIEALPWLADVYDIGKEYIRTRDGRISFAFAGLRHNINSIKSKARIRLLWVDEAEPVTENSWHTADNTVREEGAEVWVTWNPARKNSATHKRFRENPPDRSKIIQLNWRDNPWFPSTLNVKRLADFEKRPDQYAHIWEGDFVSVVDGAYFAKQLAETKARGRVCALQPDPVLPIYAFFDIGGSGKRADATAIWICQFVGPQIRVLDYIEGQGQPVTYYIAEMQTRGWKRAIIRTPHDGGNMLFTGKNYVDYWRDAQFETMDPVPNQGAGAAMLRIEAARRVFPNVYFNNTEAVDAGLEVLGWYHEKRSDDERNIGLGPEHDWSSHGADAFGLMAIVYEAPDGVPERPRERYRDRRSSRRGSWESA
ncbi:MAG: phage terminase large subunit [Thaumarchaeota archaeon]|nr:phage terminase large subunit [Nitrososphaerota archaeon]